jgi:hypothetical protein
MNTMTNRIASENDWSQSAAGQIQPMVVRLKARRFLSMVRRDAMVLTTVMVSAFSAYFYFGVLPDVRIDLGGICCVDLQPRAKQLLSGQLDRETARKIERHIRYCEYCRKHVEHLRLEAQPSGPEGDREHDWKRTHNPQIVAMQGPNVQPANQGQPTVVVR